MVEAVPNNEAVVYHEARMLDLDWQDPSIRSIQERADPNLGGIMVGKVSSQKIQPEARVDDAFYQKYLPACNVADHITREANSATVGSKGTEGYEVDLQMPVNPPHQVCHKRQTSLQYTDHDCPVVEHIGQIVCQLGDPCCNFVWSIEETRGGHRLSG